MVATINNSSTSNVNENEEITTIFVVGFPDDITEREFQNIFTFSTGFEAAILKIPSTTNDTDEQYGFGRKQIIGFVKCHTREEAQITKNILTGKKIDQDKHSILKAEFAKKNLHSKRQESKSSAQQASPPHFISQTEPVIQKHNEPPIYNYQRLPATPLSLPKIPVTSCEPIISNTSMYIHSPPVIPSDILYPTEFPELDIQDRFLQQSQQPPSRPSSTSFSFESVFQAGSNNAQTGFQDMYMDMLNLGSEAYTPSSSNVHSRANSANGNHLFALENTNLDFNGSLVSHLHPFTSESFVGKSLLPTNFSAEQGRSLNQHYSSESSHIHQFTHQHPNTLHNAISETITKLPANHSEPENNFLVETYENATFDYPGESQFMSESPPASLEDHPLVHRNQEQQHHNSNRHRQSSNLDWPPFRSIDQNPPCNTLYVGNLPPNTTPEELEILFGKSKGYRRLCFRNRPSGPMCFVEFEDVSAATQVMCEMYGFPLSTHQKGGIRLSYSKNPLGVRLAPTSGVKEDGAFGTNVTHPLLLI